MDSKIETGNVYEYAGTGKRVLIVDVKKVENSERIIAVGPGIEAETGQPTNVEILYEMIRTATDPVSRYEVACKFRNDPSVPRAEIDPTKLQNYD